MNAESAYRELVERSRERAMLAGCIELLGWDELTYMPRGGVDNRGRNLAYLSGLYHDAVTQPRLGELLQCVGSSQLVADPASPAAVNVREWRRTFDRHARLPRRLIEDLATTTTTAQQVWAEARQNNDYETFRPWLDQILSLKRSEAACLGYSAEPYDALLDDYEPGMAARDLGPLFASLRADLGPIVSSALEREQRMPALPDILRRDYPIERQRLLLESIAAELGFDFQRGRIDETPHPFFSVIGPGDCRITTRFNQHDFGEAFFATLHELGHGLYEQGMSGEHFGTPFGESASMSIHESQSRLWEVVIGRSLPFWKHVFPRVRELFHHSLHDVTLKQFHRAVNRVRPGPNRVRADAITYDLHIIVRFELEQALITSQLSTSDLPSAWNELYEETLGIQIAADAEGCLQDGHWSAGQFGYFPTYTLGNLYAAQFAEQIQRQLPHLNDDLQQGDYRPLRDWLARNIYCHGQRYLAADLVQRVTGHRPSHRPLIDSLKRRFVDAE